VKRAKGKANQAASAYLDELPPNKRRPAARLLHLYVGPGVSGLDDFDWGRVSRASLVEARSELAKSYSPSTVNSVLSCVRSVLRHGLGTGVIPPQQYLESLEVAGIDREKPTSPLELSPDTLASIFEACEKDGEAEGRRDAFVILLIACAGLDRREVAGLTDLQAPRPLERTCHVAEVRQLTGPCSLVLQDRARDVVGAWIEARGAAPGPAICKISRRGDVLATEAVTEQLTYRIVCRRAEEAGIQSISTTALKWYYQLHPPRETPLKEPAATANVRWVIEPPPRSDAPQ
jgi:hypothetical protein